jgi:hypothetical protein
MVEWSKDHCNTPCYRNPNEGHQQITRDCYEPRSKGGIHKTKFRIQTIAKSIRIPFSSGIQNSNPPLMDYFFLQ